MIATKTTGFLVTAMLLAVTAAAAQPVLTPQRNLVPQSLPAGASSQPASAAAPAPAPAPPPTPVPFDEAVLRAASDLLSKAALPERGPGDKLLLAIDPLVDGVTGM
jgi:hypothetical protein